MTDQIDMQAAAIPDGGCVMATRDTGLRTLREYRPSWSWDDCGCIVPEKILVYDNGRAVAFYAEYPAVPYLNLERLVDDHCQGGEANVEELYASLGEFQARGYRRGELFSVLRAALKYWGRATVEHDYLPGEVDAPGISVVCANPRPSTSAARAVDLDVQLTLPDGKMEIAGYEVVTTATGARRISVGAEDADEALAAIRAELPVGWLADFAGEGNTDADGYSTEDVALWPERG